MSGNPYEPVAVWRPEDHPRPAPDSAAPLDRFRRLGASEDVLDDIGRRWADASPQERQEAWASVENLSDDEVRQALAEQSDQLRDEVLAQAAQRVEAGATAPDLLEWVGRNRLRAIGVLIAEGQRAKPRKGLTEALTAIAPA